MVMEMKCVVNFIKTAFIRTGTSKKDETLQMQNVFCYDCMIDSSSLSVLLKGGPEYMKMP